MRDAVNGFTVIQRSIGLLPNNSADFPAMPWAGSGDGRGWSASLFHGFRYNDYSKRYCSSYDGCYDDILMGPIPDP